MRYIYFLDSWQETDRARDPLLHSLVKHTGEELKIEEESEKLRPSV